MRTRYCYLPIFSLDDDYAEDDNNVCLAYWCMSHKELKFNVKAFRDAYTNKNSKAIQHKYINTLNHEVIHGVVQKVLESDRFTGAFNPEWPMLNGMDPDYKRVVSMIG